MDGGVVEVCQLGKVGWLFLIDMSMFGVQLFGWVSFEEVVVWQLLQGL